jgi:hypothetical protein
MMIARIWHGWTNLENADSYESLLKDEIFRGIENRKISGYLGIQLLRRELKEKVEFVTIMMFESLESVKSFAGDNYEVAVVPPKARTLLSHFDSHSQHYEVREQLVIDRIQI